eukprot:4576346-Prymnesium_polylepis.1
MRQACVATHGPVVSEPSRWTMLECTCVQHVSMSDVVSCNGRGPAVGTCRSEVLSQNRSDPKSVGAAAVGRA